MRMQLPVRCRRNARRTVPTHSVGAAGIKQCVVSAKQAGEHLRQRHLLAVSQGIEVIDLTPRQ